LTSPKPYSRCAITDLFNPKFSVFVQQIYRILIYCQIVAPAPTLPYNQRGPINALRALSSGTAAAAADVDSSRTAAAARGSGITIELHTSRAPRDSTKLFSALSFQAERISAEP